MTLSPPRLQSLLRRHAPLLRQLEALYAEMDAHYAAVADAHAFVCRGCEDNCCLTRFHHHTLVEVAGLYRGFLTLDENQRRGVVQRARAYCRALQADAPHGSPFRHLCPLNQDGRCLLYPLRPMICRLHGIPHVLRHPRKGLIAGPGCHVFDAHRRRPEDGPRLDRTPLYAAMADLEQTLRREAGWAQPLRLTVAEMIVGFAAVDPPMDPLADPGPGSGGEGREDR